MYLLLAQQICLLYCLCIYCLPNKFAFFTVDVFIACPTHSPSLLFMYLLLAQQIRLLYCLCIYCLQRRQICWASNKYINSKEGEFVGQAINT
jgi:hypothetical protein